MLLIFANEIEVVEEDAFSGSEDTLYVLHLYNNKLTSFPSAVGKMRKLMGLHIHNNPISTIREDVLRSVSSTLSGIIVPNALSNLTSLIRLDFMTSLITEIQDTDFSKMDKLERMYFTNSPLHTVSDNAFHGLKSLRYLTLDNTHLTAVPKATMNLPSLLELSLSNTKVVCTCTSLGWIKQWPRHSEVEIYGSCYNIRMTIALYVYKELPKC
ncbi:leucine-rich repeat LGI family member 2-like [Mytilus californianus]|uniref:leucine-rich repeat LGI family member 2-like n=1 Tax=Mytilus californianus TaxID=6549 RepID=UPI0022452FF3|nr:leucine-rich repeat LGI family member 2-like [Mytilus californianus]